MVTYSCEGCETPMIEWPTSLYDNICGTDGNSYYNILDLECMQRSDYGKRVNLQFKHDGACFTWYVFFRTFGRRSDQKFIVST